MAEFRPELISWLDTVHSYDLVPEAERRSLGKWAAFFCFVRFCHVEIFFLLLSLHTTLRYVNLLHVPVRYVKSPYLTLPPFTCVLTFLVWLSLPHFTLSY